MKEKFAYFPHTREDIHAMLQKAGARTLEDFYSDVPADCIFKGDYALPEAMSEQQIRDHFEKLADMTPKLKVFAGCGAYDHYTPAVVPYITSRSEFLTAYTPYQCEISQGTLRYIFEFQTIICNLTGMDVANASMYDGPTAAAEAMRLCVSSSRGRKSVIVSDTLHAHVFETLETYAKYGGINLIKVGASVNGQSDRDALERCLQAGDAAGVIVPETNRFGIVEDHDGFASLIHEAGALMVEYCDPSTLAIVKTPAEWGADIAVGDAQPLGMPLNYGGPYAGFMACKTQYMRKLPGRIVGQTVDAEGRRCFVLTLQAREQHIRREKATSNICSNESLMALWATVYTSLMGPEGLRKVNDLCYEKSHYLRQRLLETGLFTPVFDGACFIKEFVLKPAVKPQALFHRLMDNGYLAAVPTKEGYVSFCVTDKRSKADIDALVEVIKKEGRI